MAGDGITVAFPYAIKLINSTATSQNDLTVYVQDNTGTLQLKTIVTDYTQTYDDETENGTITFLTATASDEFVFAIRERVQTQPFDIPINSDFDAEKIETMVDNMSVQVSDLDEQVDRSLKLPETFVGQFDVTEAPVDDNLLVYTGTAGSMKNSGTTLTDIITGATDAAASAAAAASSASAASTSASNASTSASSASTSASNASTSASAASTSETNAGDSETNAAASAAAAEVAKIEWQGVYNAGTAYALNDAVEFDGSSYISIQAGTGNQPDTSPTFWDLMAQKGTTPATLNDIADVTITSPVNDEVLTLEGGVWKNKPSGGGGKVLTYEESIITTGNTGFTSSSYVDITGVTVSITPVSSSSKIKIEFNFGVQFTTGGDTTTYRLAIVEGVSNILREVTLTRPTTATQRIMQSLVARFDNSATSSLTFKLQGLRVAGSGTPRVNNTSSSASVEATEIAN